MSAQSLFHISRRKDHRTELLENPAAHSAATFAKVEGESGSKRDKRKLESLVKQNPFRSFGKSHKASTVTEVKSLRPGRIRGHA